MKKALIIVAICGVTNHTFAGSLDCGMTASTVPSGFTSSSSGVSVSIHCTSKTNAFWCSYTDKHCDSIQMCSACNSGYVPTQRTLPSNGRCKTISFSDCCLPCTNCTSDTGWTYHKTGYVRRATRTCNCDGTCSASYRYACASGYYGSSSNGTSGCSLCPNGGYSNVGSNTDITSCYLIPGTGYTDSSGTYTYTQPCYYKK